MPVSNPKETPIIPVRNPNGKGIARAGFMPALANRKKYFTNGRLRIDFFQPSSLLVVNDAIMGRFDKQLIIKKL